MMYQGRSLSILTKPKTISQILGAVVLTFMTVGLIMMALVM